MVIQVGDARDTLEQNLVCLTEGINALSAAADRSARKQTITQETHSAVSTSVRSESIPAPV